MSINYKMLSLKGLKKLHFIESVSPSDRVATEKVSIKLIQLLFAASTLFSDSCNLCKNHFNEQGEFVAESI